jgi:hypothetical protein
MSGTTPKPLDEEKGEKKTMLTGVRMRYLSFYSLLYSPSPLSTGFIRPSYFSPAAFALGGRQRADKETA